VMSSAINSSRPLQAKVARGGSGAVVNDKQHGGAVVLLKFFSFQIFMIQMQMMFGI